MTRLAFILSLLCTPAMADAIDIRDSTEGHVAEVFYSNARGQNSKATTLTLDHEGTQVRIRIGVNIEGMAERLYVEPVSPEFIAFPPEVDVLDGEDAVVQIMRPMF